jgi:hypothetical protein
MKKIILTINNKEIGISGDLDVVSKCVENIISSALNEKIKPAPAVQATLMFPSKDHISSQLEKDKIAKFSKEDNISFYKYLSTYGDFEINQFEITRGGKTNPMQYIVCTVFDKNQHRYIHYNPKSEDKFIKSFSPSEAISNLENNVEGFHLLHQVAAGIQNKTRTMAFTEKPNMPTLESVLAKGEVIFTDYDIKGQTVDTKLGNKTTKKVAKKA